MNKTPTDGSRQLDAVPERPDLRVVITVHLDNDGRPVGCAQADHVDFGCADAELPDAVSTEPFTFEGWLSLMAGLARLLAEQKES